MRLFVEEVRRHAFLGYGVHALRAYLHLHPAPYGGHHGGLQALVAVVLGVCYPVAETRGVRRELARNEGIDLEALLFFLLTRHPLEDDAHGVKVEYLVEVNVLVLNLLPAAVYALHPRFQRILVALFVEHLPHGCHEALLQLLAGAGRGGYLGFYLGVFVGVGVAHHQLLKFCLYVIQSQTVRQRYVQVRRLACYGQLLGVFHRAQRPHVVQAVTELEEDDVGVVAHRQQYLAVVFRLLAVGLLHHHDVVYLGHAVHYDGHPVAEHHA